MGYVLSRLQRSEDLRRDRRHYRKRSDEGEASEPRRPAYDEQSLHEAVGLRGRHGYAEPAGQVGEAEDEGHGAAGDLQADGHPHVQLRSPARPEPHGSSRAQARSVSDYQEALEDRMSDYRAEVGETLSAQTQTETSRNFEMADLVAQHRAITPAPTA